MSGSFSLRRLLPGLLTGLALAIATFSVPIGFGSLTPAIAQGYDEFVIALEPYGRWIRHAPFGEVWIPADVPPDWRPYEYGHWVYTDEWGWYWVADEEEEDWGWITYHYGRWAFDREIGWFWVPGEEWAPAWVDWRYGDDYVGWAPLPPDQFIELYDVEPAYWVFLPLRYMADRHPRRHYIPHRRRAAILHSTRIVNRTLGIKGRRIGVNPGIAPSFIAHATGTRLHAYRVRPHILGKTSGVADAIKIRPQDLRNRRIRPKISVQQTTVIQPLTSTAPQPLGKHERGRFGVHPLGAVRGGFAPPQERQLNSVVPPPTTIKPPPTVIKPSPSPTPRFEHRERRELRRMPPPGTTVAPTSPPHPPTVTQPQRPRVYTRPPPHVNKESRKERHRHDDRPR